MKLAIGAILASMSGQGDIQNLTPVDRDIAGIVHQVKGVMDENSIPGLVGKQEKAKKIPQAIPIIISPVKVIPLIDTRLKEEGIEKLKLGLLSDDEEKVIEISFQERLTNRYLFSIKIFFPEGDFSFPIVLDRPDKDNVFKVLNEALLALKLQTEKNAGVFEIQKFYQVLDTMFTIKRYVPGEQSHN